MNYGNIYFAGDSAHVHAPIGGRGCNLGIEDAFVFSKLLEANKLSDYHAERKPKIDGFVNQVKRASSVLISSKHTYLRWIFPRIMGIINPLVRDNAIKFATGLDYNLPQL